MKNKSLDYYLGLPYKVDIYPEEDGSGYTAVIPDLPGCITSADTINELWEMLDEAKALWLEVALAENTFIPDPTPVTEEEYSGKFVIRLPQSLHRQLSIRAEKENTSLNQLVVMLLSEGMGRWKESHAHIREYKRIFDEYRSLQKREFSNLYQLFLSQLILPHEEIDLTSCVWEPGDWAFSIKETTGIVGDKYG
jgi:antitoxin HicB